MHPENPVRVRTGMDDAVDQLRSVADTLHDIAPRMGHDAREIDQLAEECDALANTIERLGMVERNQTLH